MDETRRVFGMTFQESSEKIVLHFLRKQSLTRRLYCVYCPNTVFGSKAICAQDVYFLQHSTMPSVTCLRLSDVSVICHVTYFQFPIQSVFLPCVSARQHSGVLVYAIRTSDVAENLGRFLVRSVQRRRMI